MVWGEHQHLQCSETLRAPPEGLLTVSRHLSDFSRPDVTCLPDLYQSLFITVTKDLKATNHSVDKGFVAAHGFGLWSAASAAVGRDRAEAS
jgi:hypothetical protein